MKAIGYILMLAGIWMMVSPQAVLGLPALKWMARYAFAGEAFLGAFLVAAAFLLIRPAKPRL